MSYTKPVSTQVTTGFSASDGTTITSIVIRYVHTMAENTVVESIQSVIREEVRKAVLADTELRELVKNAIQAASVNLPLDAIAQAVKQAVNELKTPEPTKNAQKT